ncbi:uncharacterized protein LOC127108726 [Lathyrus oleraceus]|uniref:uncharacterized protein LOC127108726 n=1 Tax=Pisum sativum TaxID=3888 RepID=UPI0021CFA863|nr:uncharacterized protein LOC127108726 [Pisum sativum]
MGADDSDIHGIVPSAPKATFDSVLLVNNTYTMTNFWPLPNGLMFKTSEHQFIIRFTAGTSLSDINKHEIGGKKLNFKPFVDIITGKWKKDLLIGKYLISVSNAYNIKNLVINEEVPEIVDFRRRIPKDYDISSSSQLISTQFNMWSQNFYGSQLTSFGKFMSQATALSLGDIVKLPDASIFMACHKCPKVAKGSFPPYICVDNHSTKIEILRYKIDIEVVDNGSNAIFVFWDLECTELLEMFVAQLRQTMVEDGIHDPLEFPSVLHHLLGYEFAFKVKWHPKWKNGRCWKSRKKELSLIDEELQNLTLVEIEKILQANLRTLKDLCPIPYPNGYVLEQLSNCLIYDEWNYDVSALKSEFVMLYAPFTKLLLYIIDKYIV